MTLISPLGIFVLPCGKNDLSASHPFSPYRSSAAQILIGQQPGYQLPPPPLPQNPLPALVTRQGDIGSLSEAVGRRSQQDGEHFRLAAAPSVYASRPVRIIYCPIRP